MRLNSNLAVGHITMHNCAIVQLDALGTVDIAFYPSGNNDTVGINITLNYAIFSYRDTDNAVLGGLDITNYFSIDA